MLTAARPEGMVETAGREFVPVAAGRSEAVAGLPGRVTSENEFIFFYCVRGRGWCEIDGNRHEIMPGQLFVIPAKAQPSYATYGERLWSLIWIQLATINTSPFAAKLNFAPQPMALGPSEKTLILALFQDVLHAFEMPCPQHLQQVSQRTMALLASTICIPRDSPQMESDAAARIGRTIEYMREHLNEPLRAATLAGVANMSLPHYFAQFKRVVGSSPIDYLIKLRMEHARRLLEETSWSVKEVAVSLGYDDPLYFSRVFKSINQTAPSDFRARKRDTNGG
jgi:AraC family transcriptional regulator of arabinose operon